MSARASSSAPSRSTGSWDRRPRPSRRSRRSWAGSSPPTARGRRVGSFAADSLDELLAETRALEAEGSLDLETIVAIQRASGAIAARTDRRLVVLLHRYAVTRRLIWEHCVAAMQAGRLDPGLLAAFGRFLLLWNELTSLAVTDGYRTAERDILARAVEARRGALQELLGVVADDAVERGPTAPRGACDTAWTPTGRTA